MDAHILDLLSAPGVVGLSHVGWGLNGRDELQSKVSDTGEADNRTGNILQDMTMQHERADEDVKDTTSQEREEEGRVSVHVIGNLGKKLQSSNNETEDDNVHANDDRAQRCREELSNTAEDHNRTDGDVSEAENVGEIHLVAMLSNQSEMVCRFELSPF